MNIGMGHPENTEMAFEAEIVLKMVKNDPKKGWNEPVALWVLVWMCWLWKGLASGLYRLVVPMEIPVRLVEGSSAAEGKQSRRWFSSETEVGIDGTSKGITRGWWCLGASGIPAETGLWTCPTLRFRNDDVWTVFRFLHRATPLGSLSPAHVAVTTIWSLPAELPSELP